MVLLMPCRRHFGLLPQSRVLVVDTVLDRELAPCQLWELAARDRMRSEQTRPRYRKGVGAPGGGVATDLGAPGDGAATRADLNLGSRVQQRAAHKLPLTVANPAADSVLFPPMLPPSPT